MNGFKFNYDHVTGNGRKESVIGVLSFLVPLWWHNFSFYPIREIQTVLEKGQSAAFLKIQAHSKCLDKIGNFGVMYPKFEPPYLSNKK